MPKTCAQAVGGCRKSVSTRANLSTQYIVGPITRWKKWTVTLLSVHNFCIQLCTPKLLHITGVVCKFSPLSTALIMNTKWKTKENLLIGSGG